MKQLLALISILGLISCAKGISPFQCKVTASLGTRASNSFTPISLNYGGVSTRLNQKLLKALDSLPNNSIRVELPGPGAEAITACNLANVTAHSKKLLIIVGPNLADSTEISSDAARVSICGYGAPKLSTINMQGHLARVEAYLKVFKHQNLDINAFELGNELDWACFNGDLAIDRPPTPDEEVDFINSYNSFALPTLLLIKSYYPYAKIFTFGLSNWNNWTVNGGLKNSFNLVRATEAYQYMNGVSIHTYPSPNAIDAELQKFNNVNFDKPIWVTEFGFSTQLGSTVRKQAFVDFLNAFNGRAQNMFVYSLDDSVTNNQLVDQFMSLLPETSFFELGSTP